jgi:hypothetical protein
MAWSQLTSLCTLWFAVLLCPDLLAAQTQSQARSARPIELVQVALHEAPQGVNPTGFSLNSRGDLLIWSQQPGTLLARFVDGWRTLLAEPLPGRIAAAWRDSTTVEVIDLDNRRLLVIDARGYVLESFAVDIATDIWSAVRSGRGWYVLGTSADSSVPYITLLDSTLRTEFTAELPTALVRTLNVHTALLSPHSRGVLITERVGSFETYLIADNAVTRFGMPPSFLTADSSRSESPKWVAFAVVSATNVYLQSFADLTSDARVINIYDESGILLRETQTHLPFAFHGGSTSGDLVIGVTRLPETEIRIYKITPSPPDEL